MVRPLAITLLRHGITEENRKNCYIGWTDSPLAEDHQLLQRDAYPSPDVVICSDLIRCQQTYQFIYGINSNIPVVFSSDWRELSFGDWEQKTHAQLSGDPLYEKWLNNWSTSPIPGGESFDQFSMRIMKGWKKLKDVLTAQSINEAVVITHGGPIRKILMEFAPQHKLFWEWQVENGSGYRLETTDERLRRNERCISLQEVPFRERENGYNR